MRKIYLRLSILFCILTFIGSMYYIINHFETTAGYAGVPLVFMLLFSSLYFREKKKDK